MVFEKSHRFLRASFVAPFPRQVDAREPRQGRIADLLALPQRTDGLLVGERPAKMQGRLDQQVPGDAPVPVIGVVAEYLLRVTATEFVFAHRVVEDSGGHQAVVPGVTILDACRSPYRLFRSAERRVGKECVTTCRDRWSR